MVNFSNYFTCKGELLLGVVCYMSVRSFIHHAVQIICMLPKGKRVYIISCAPRPLCVSSTSLCFWRCPLGLVSGLVAVVKGQIAVCVCVCARARAFSLALQGLECPELANTLWGKAAVEDLFLLHLCHLLVSWAPHIWVVF